jgi:NAD(P)-dependent dehydrogenase (short-subunit alcohol dehydrogenase family)
MIDPARFDRRVAIVTGGAAGIGAVTARAYANHGATVIVVDRDAANLAAVGSQIGAQTHVADLTDEEQVANVLRDIIDQHGRIDVLVNLAGIYGARPEVEEQTLDGFRTTLAANLESTFLCCRGVLPHMRERQYGRIITTASGTVPNPQPGLSAYVAAKSGVIGFTRVLAKEVGGAGITANVVLPGLIETEHVLTMLGESAEARARVDGFFQATLGHQSVKRRGRPEDVAHAILCLTDEGAGFITGQSLLVDGGSSFF